ncbi:MAG: amidohydrolase family protein [Rhodoferax sp.]|nr:amidohydrolase family protein [Rhodoferax sp.]
MSSTVIRNVRPLGREAVDVVLTQGKISSLLPVNSADPALATLIDGQGQLLLPALVESHCHLDKTLWATPWRPNSAGPTRNHRISNEQRLLKDFKVPMAERAGPLIEHCIAQGSLYYRSHLDVQTVWGLQHVKDMLALREKYKHLIDIQLVAFPQGGLLTVPGTVELMEQAMDLGVDVVGGIDPAGIDLDPIRHLEKIFSVATRYQSGIDIHLHDLGEMGRWEIERIADMTDDQGMQGQVMISHAYALGAFPPADLHALADRLAELQISIMTCAPPHVTVPPVTMLRSRGVNVCSGSDGIRDAWSPMGNGDMLERAMLMALRFNWSKDEDLAAAFDVVTQGGAKALHISDYGLDVGCAANLMLIPGENLPDVVLNRSPKRTVISRGKVVAKDGVFMAG